MRCKALRREGHGLENRRIDRPERDVVRIEAQRALQLGVVVGADAEPQARLADRADVGVVEIALAEMDPRRALVDRDAPIIVDDQDRARFRANRQRLARLARDPGLVLVLDPQLDETRAGAGQPCDPSGAVDDRVEGIEASPSPSGKGGEGAHVSTALPTTGVEGAAMSRGCIGPARKAARPASIACAKARAIATGSPALATAVLSSTPS